MGKKNKNNRKTNSISENETNEIDETSETNETNEIDETNLINEKTEKLVNKLSIVNNDNIVIIVYNIIKRFRILVKNICLHVCI